MGVVDIKRGDCGCSDGIHSDSRGHWGGIGDGLI